MLTRISGARLRRLRRLADSGAQASIVAVEGMHPAVLAHCPGPEGAPTVLLHAHHDIQRPRPEEEWASLPFQAAERNGCMYGRGSADNKPGVITHAAALRLYAGRPPVGGEEEIGSPGLPALFARVPELGHVDIATVPDGAR